MRALVTGATGFTGSFVIDRLLRENVAVKCLLRTTSEVGALPVPNLEIARGDLNDADSITRALEGCDALVNIASLGFGHAANIVRATLRARVSRAVFMSTTAIFTRLNASSKAIRLAAEREIMESGLAYTILRPTMIYGTSRDRNICRLIRFLSRWPVIPILGTGECLQQPVYVGDVAEAVGRALLAPAAAGCCYNISCAAPLTFNEVVTIVCRQLGRRVLKIHFPANLAVGALKAAELFTRRLPIKAEQVRRLNEHKDFAWDPANRDFAYQPRSFAEGIRLELIEMGLAR